MGAKLDDGPHRGRNLLACVHLRKVLLQRIAPHNVSANQALDWSIRARLCCGHLTGWAQTVAELPPHQLARVLGLEGGLALLERDNA